MASKYPYNPANWIVETHYAIDVMHKDYGKDEICATRAVDRLLPLLDSGALRELRVWHAGSLIAKYEAKR